FYLHGRYLIGQPSNILLIVVASAIDVMLISAIVLLWHSSTVGGRTGLASPFFVFYYPALLALAFVVPRRLTVGFTAATAAIYAGAWPAGGHLVPEREGPRPPPRARGGEGRARPLLRGDPPPAAPGRRRDPRVGDDAPPPPRGAAGPREGPPSCPPRRREPRA